MVVRVHIIEIHKKQPQHSFALHFSHLQGAKIKIKKKNANVFICGISSNFLIKYIKKKREIITQITLWL